MAVTGFCDGRQALLTVDGQQDFAIYPNDVVIIHKNPYKADFVWIDRPLFFDNLRRKMLGYATSAKSSR